MLHTFPEITLIYLQVVVGCLTTPKLTLPLILTVASVFLGLQYLEILKLQNGSVGFYTLIRLILTIFFKPFITEFKRSVCHMTSILITVQIIVATTLQVCETKKYKLIILRLKKIL